jgi:glycosyltransferase involved in cell wall biosynthesis
MAYPTITAVMVTLGRMPLVLESYKCFQNQTYPKKKLLIVNDGNPEEHNSLCKLATKDKRITVVHVGGERRTLGELRNISIEHAPSDLSIQWDDDDWYGPDRMMLQWKGMKTGKAVMLTEQLHYFRDTNEVAWTTAENGIEGTILFDRRCGLRYPAATRGEDTVLKYELIKMNLLELVGGGICYCRTYHGSNTWEREHHDRRILKLGKKKSQVNHKLLVEAAQTYKWKQGWKVLYGLL